MRKLNYLMADFKLRVDRITYDATKKLDALAAELKYIEIDEALSQAKPSNNAKVHRDRLYEFMHGQAAFNNMKALNQGLYINAFNISVRGY